MSETNTLHDNDFDFCSWLAISHSQIYLKYRQEWLSIITGIKKPIVTDGHIGKNKVKL